MNILEAKHAATKIFSAILKHDPRYWYETWIRWGRIELDVHAIIDELQPSPLEEHLAIIIRCFGMVMLSESDDGHSGWCISDCGGGSAACCATFECAAELFVARFRAPPPEPCQYPQRSE